MRGPFKLWLRETAKLTIRYIYVGCSFIPVGIAYAVWTKGNPVGTLPTIVCLAVGLSCAALVWAKTSPKPVIESIKVSPAMLAALDPATQHWQQTNLIYITYARPDKQYVVGASQRGTALHPGHWTLDWSNQAHQRIGAKYAGFRSLSS